MALDEIAGAGGGAGGGSGDGGAGGGAGGSGGGGGEGGGGGVAVEEEVVTTEGEGGGEGGAGGGEGGEHTETEEDRLPGDESTDDVIETDGRKMPERTKAALDKLAKIDPQAAKDAREAFFSTKSIMAEYPEAKSVREVVRAIRTQKAILDSVGGMEGIEKVQKEASDYAAEIADFANGKRELIEQLHSSNPHATMVAGRNVLELLAEKSPELHEQAILPSFHKKLVQAELPGYLAKAAQFCVDGKGQDAYNTIQQIAAWVDKVKKSVDDLNTERETTSKHDPRLREIEERENAVTQKEKRDYDRSVSNGVTSRNNTAIAKATAQLFKDLKLDGEGKREFSQGLMNRVWKAMKADKPWQKLANAMVDKGDAERAAEFIAEKFQELLPDHFIKYRNAMYPNYAKAKPGAAGAAKKDANANANKNNNGAGGGGGGNPAASVVTKKPAPHEIDWTKTTEAMYHVGRGWGEAILTNGKRVRWEWEKV